MEQSSLPVAALIFLTPFLGGIVAAYRVGASPRTAYLLAVALVLSIATFWAPVVDETPLPISLVIFIWSWGMIGKLLWERRQREMASLMRDEAHISQP